MDVSLGDLISGGGTLTFAFVVWQEVRAIRLLLTGQGERIAKLEERTRGGVSSMTPAHGVTLISPHHEEGEGMGIDDSKTK